MTKNRIDELLRDQKRAFYWLSKESGVSPATLARLKKDKAQGITFNTLEKICKILKCQPGDLIKAAKRGLSVEEFRQAAIETDSENETSFSARATPGEWEAALDEFINSEAFRNISWTVDDSRESIYREREDAQL